MDTVALALTAVLGILSYLMQAKIQRDAEKTEKASEQAHSDNVRAEARAGKLLARVQDQMQHYARPLTYAHVSLAAPLPPRGDPDLVACKYYAVLR